MPSRVRLRPTICYHVGLLFTLLELPSLSERYALLSQANTVCRGLGCTAARSRQKALAASEKAIVERKKDTTDSSSACVQAILQFHNINPYKARNTPHM